MSKEKDNSEYIKLEKHLTNILEIIKKSKNNHEKCLSYMEQGATKGKKTLDNGAIEKCIKKEKNMIKKIKKIISELNLNNNQ